MTPRTPAWLPAALAWVALAGAGGRAWQATHPDPRFGDARMPADFESGQSLLHPDAPCTDDERPGRLRDHARALRAQDPDRALTRIGEGVLRVGEWRGVPVIFRPCEGTFALLPSRLPAGALRAPPR